MLYALLILFSVLLIVVLINGLYQHNHEILNLDYTSVYGALPPKPSFGEGMRFSAEISLQSHGVDLKQLGHIVPNLKITFKTIESKFKPTESKFKQEGANKLSKPLPEKPTYEPPKIQKIR